MKLEDRFVAGDLSKRDISNMPDKEFKIIIIKILTGLGKRVKDNSKPLNKEIFLITYKR